MQSIPSNQKHKHQKASIIIKFYELINLSDDPYRSISNTLQQKTIHTFNHCFTAFHDKSNTISFL